MNEQPRQTLSQLVARHGHEVLRDARRCEGLLKDYSAAYRREVSVLVSALEEHVPQDMLAAPAGTPREVLLARMAHRLSDHRALSEPAAAWAVNSWALALGLISEDELKALEARTAVRHVEDTKRGKVEGRAEPAQVVSGRASASTSIKASASARAGGAAVIVSADGGDYTSITAALRTLAPGSRILVRPGIYEESIALDAAVEIVGDGPREEIIIRGTSASCLRAQADGARVSGVTLRGAARGEAAFFAVEITRGKLLLEDCDISSDTLSCVAVHGPEAAPTIRRCRIHDGADSGLYFFDEARGAIEDCEVYGHANVGIAITSRAGPIIRRSKIYGGANAGVVAWQDGTGLVEECEIYGNRLASLGVSEGAKLTARACRLHGGGNSGVFIHTEGEAILEGCELYGHREAEAAVTTRGKLFLDNCRIHHSHDSGVHVRDGGQALLQTCVVERNAGAGVSVGANSVLAVLTSQIKENARYAVEVSAGATARVEDTDLTGNGLGPWNVEYGAEVESARNRD
jgi:hypothetical protein